MLALSASIALFIGWLADPEAVRKGRNLVVSYLDLRPEPQDTAFSPSAVLMGNFAGENLAQPAADLWAINVANAEERVPVSHGVERVRVTLSTPPESTR